MHVADGSEREAGAEVVSGRKVLVIRGRAEVGRGLGSHVPDTVFLIVFGEGVLFRSREVDVAVEHVEVEVEACAVMARKFAIVQVRVRRTAAWSARTDQADVAIAEIDIPCRQEVSGPVRGVVLTCHGIEIDGIEDFGGIPEIGPCGVAAAIDAEADLARSKGGG